MTIKNTYSVIKERFIPYGFEEMKPLSIYGNAMEWLSAPEDFNSKSYPGDNTPAGELYKKYMEGVTLTCRFNIPVLQIPEIQESDLKGIIEEIRREVCRAYGVPRTYLGNAFTKQKISYSFIVISAKKINPPIKASLLRSILDKTNLHSNIITGIITVNEEEKQMRIVQSNPSNLGSFLFESIQMDLEEQGYSLVVDVEKYR